MNDIETTEQKHFLLDLSNSPNLTLERGVFITWLSRFASFHITWVHLVSQMFLRFQLYVKEIKVQVKAPIMTGALWLWLIFFLMPALFKCGETHVSWMWHYHWTAKAQEPTRNHHYLLDYPIIFLCVIDQCAWDISRIVLPLFTRRADGVAFCVLRWDMWSLWPSVASAVVTSVG